MTDASAPLDRAAVERVLRRASDLSAADHVPDPHGRLTEAMVLEAATEAGLDPDSVRLSLAIERIGATPTSERLDRLAGSAHVVVDRVVSLDPDTLLRRVDEVLVRKHGLRRARERADRGEWRRRTDTVGSIQRAASKFGADGPSLASLDRVEVRTGVVDGSRTLVRVVASRRPQRTVALAGGTSLGAAGVVVGAAAATVAVPLALVGAPLVAGGVLVARTGRRQAGELVDDLERLLDLVERGSTPASLSGELRRMLKQWKV